MEKLTNTLKYWQEKYDQSKSAYDVEITNMNDNELAYKGTRKIKTPTGADAAKQGGVSRKMCFELIETQADVTIPAPRVISLKGREDRARMIESMLRNEIDRLPFEEIIDEHARLTPTLGGSVFFTEWNNDIHSQFGVGEIQVKNIHPKHVIPQQGVYKLDEMDYFFLEFEQTEDFIKNNYGVDVTNESDQGDEPQIHMREHIFAYYRNPDQTIGLYSWVGDSEIQNFDNYFARLQQVCAKCGKVKINNVCECGSKKFTRKIQQVEELTINKVVSGQDGKDTVETENIKVDYYIPKIWPLVIHKNVGLIDKFLGGSDVDAIKDQQNDLNIYMTKIREKTLKGGSWITYPKTMKIPTNDDELKLLPIKNAAEKSLIEITNVQPNTSNDISMLNLNYEIGRQTLGITDSFQGRSDYTASSGKAKEIQAAQAAGRLESKKKMKDFSFSQLYETMFKFKLAFTDEQRPYVEEQSDGSLGYKYFDKRFFIDKNDDDTYYYDDAFIFSTDSSGTLANDREAMWKETRTNFDSGVYGDPSSIDTLLMFWTTMNKLHYPGAREALEYLKQLQQQQQAQSQKIAEQQAYADAFAKNKTTELLKENLELKQGTTSSKQNADRAISKVGGGQ